MIVAGAWCAMVYQQADIVEVMMLQGLSFAAVGRSLVDNGRDAIVWGDLQEVRSELFIFTDVDRVNDL